MRGSSQDPHTAAEETARRLEARREQIIATYEQRLLAADELGAWDAPLIQLALAHAGQIIADVVASLRAGQVLIDDDYHRIARDVGVTRALGGVHPQESLQAASIFFQTALELMPDAVEPGPAGTDQLRLIALVLQESAALRVSKSISIHAGFLSEQVEGARIGERRRIARDLHDRIGNSVTVAHRQLELFELYRASQPARADDKIRIARTAIKDSIDNLRTVAHDLRSHEPVQSLEDALRSFLDTIDTIDALDSSVELIIKGDEDWAPPALLDEALLIIREAAANALRYAGARSVLIDVVVTPDYLSAVVQDDGCGFDTEAVLKQGRPVGSGGLGLTSMMERAELLDGTLQIESRIGRGTRVEFWAPFTGRPPLEP